MTHETDRGASAPHLSDPINIADLAHDFTRKVREVMDSQRVTPEQAIDALTNALGRYALLHV